MARKVHDRDISPTLAAAGRGAAEHFCDLAHTDAFPNMVMNVVLLSREFVQAF